MRQDAASLLFEVVANGVRCPQEKFEGSERVEKKKRQWLKIAGALHLLSRSFALGRSLANEEEVGSVLGEAVLKRQTER